MASSLSFEQISEMNERVDDLKEQYVAYLERHPELRHVLNDFVTAVLMEKPDDVYTFAQRHFLALKPDTAAADAPSS
eukprot:CAMPEP_0196782772 /NCGR_PEP_ID=MMETSP1104-20130614/12041_1 /TAXON_ID=33652 /ORGANISM="Cafeteria sp., Strain Caron Lab Isolate" /LENGTH=76 /DNA_ID=CAMNT_0042153015 /DNA_START=30 /DNA_END=260 /DNA_ORIENTATION=+